MREEAQDVDPSVDKDMFRGIPVARLRGEVEAVGCEGFAQTLLAASDPATRCLVVDLSDVTYIDSDCLDCIIQTHRQLVSEGGYLAVVCCNPFVGNLLSSTGLDRILDVHGSLEEAAESMPACRPA